MDSKVVSEEASDRTACEAIVKIKNVDGLNMLASTRFIKSANTFSSSVTVRRGEKEADGKSIMQMCMLAAPFGSKLRITAEGEDAREAIGYLRELVEEKMFSEPVRNGQK